MNTSPLEIPPPTGFPVNPDELEHPPQPQPLFDFTRLEDPPDDWEYFGHKYGSVKRGYSRSLQLPQVRVLMKHYFWGIHHSNKAQSARTTRKSPTLRSLQSLIFKLIYYMQEIHRPKTWGQLLDVNRDSGPRLLKYTLDPRPKPISRWYPCVPDIDARILDAYIRPLTAPPDLPDYLLQQYVYSADSFYTPPPSPRPRAPTVEARDEEFLRVSLLEHMNPGTMVEPNFSLTLSPGPTPPKVPFNYKRHADESLQTLGKRNRELSPGAPAYLGRPRPPTPVHQDPVFAADELTTFTWIPALAPSDTVAPIGRLQLGPLIPNSPPDVDTKVITDAVERAVMNVVYDDLERDSSAPIKDAPRRNLTARSFDEMLKMKLGSFLCTENVRMSPLTFEWDPNGTVFPLRGRGPIWNDMSCAYDAVIVAGMLLDAGCTKIDRAHNRAAEFKEIEKAFIEVTNASWDTFDEKTSIHVRDEFLHMFIAGQSQLKLGMPVPPWAAWSALTKSFAQFRYHHVERVTPCKCQSTRVFINAHQGSCILPGFQAGDEDGVELQTLIERCFYRRKSFKCNKCHDPMGVVGERKIGQLPLRLVMTFDQKTRIINHTEDLEFNYIDYQDKPQVAHYRWLGGVYNNENHARLFWTDTKRGEKDEGNIMMYDCQLNSGVIVGGIPAFQQSEKVPTEWVHHKAIPLLFFEQILNPTTELLAKAHNAVYDMGNCLSQNHVVLKEHEPWTLASPPAKSESWTRVLSRNGERFSEFSPVWVTESNPRGSPADVSMSNVDPRLLDPSVIDPSLIDPALYSIDIAPIFDYSLSDMGPRTPEMEPDYTNKPHMFGSMMDTPGWLIQQSELWPSGPPDAEGALEFPDLPTWPTPRAGPRRATVSSDITMVDADSPPRNPRPSFPISHTDGLKKAAITNYAMAKQALSPQQKEFLGAQSKSFDPNKTFSDGEDIFRRRELRENVESKRQEDYERWKREDRRRQEQEREQERRENEEKRRQEQKREQERRENEDKRREEQEREQERRQREDKRRQEQEKEQERKQREDRERQEREKREERERQKRDKKETQDREEEKKKKGKGKGTQSEESEMSRRPGLRPRRKKVDPTWRPDGSDAGLES